MTRFDYTVTDPSGLHARPAGLLVKETKKYGSTVTVRLGEKSADAKKLLALMGMGIRAGDTVTVTVEGSDEAVAASSLKEFFERNL